MKGTPQNTSSCYTFFSLFSAQVFRVSVHILWVSSNNKIRITPVRSSPLTVCWGQQDPPGGADWGVWGGGGSGEGAEDCVKGGGDRQEGGAGGGAAGEADRPLGALLRCLQETSQYGRRKRRGRVMAVKKLWWFCFNFFYWCFLIYELKVANNTRSSDIISDTLPLLFFVLLSDKSHQIAFQGHRLLPKTSKGWFVNILFFCLVFARSVTPCWQSWSG